MSARFDAEPPARTPALPPRLRRQLDAPAEGTAPWIWLVRRGWDEARLRQELTAADSRELVKAVVEEADLDQSQYRISANLMPHFEAFLARQLHPQARRVEGGEQCLSFPLDGSHRLIVLHSRDQPIHLPPWTWTAGELFPDEDVWQRHQGGLALISRPSVTDCHRTAFPAAGVPQQPRAHRPARDIPGPPLLHRWTGRGLPHAASVSLASRHGGPIELLELGGCGPTGVVQTFRPDDPVKRGADKGWFRFGNNWMITWFSPDRFLPDDDVPLDESGSSSHRSLRALRGQRLGITI